MLLAMRRGAGGGLLFLQSRSLFRGAGRRLVRGVTVTEASPADLEYVHSRLNPGAPLLPPAPGLAVTTLVAVRHGTVIGVITLVRHPPSRAPFAGYWLFGLYVLHPLHRGVGIGEALTRTVLDIARQEGAPAVHLVVSQTNAPAISLYRKLGFRQCVLPVLEERLEEEARRQDSRDITMVKRFHE